MKFGESLVSEDILGDDQVTKCICQIICSGTNWQYVGTVRHVVGGQNCDMVTGCQWGLNDKMVGLIGSMLLVSSVKNSLGKLFQIFFNFLLHFPHIFIR